MKQISMDKEKLRLLMIKIKGFPFETKDIDSFIQKANLITALFAELERLPSSDADEIIKEMISDINVSVAGLTWSLDYVRGDMVRHLDATNLLWEKLDSMGHFYLAISKLFFPVDGENYFNALRSAKALVRYESALANSISFEMKIIAYRLRRKD